MKVSQKLVDFEGKAGSKKLYLKSQKLYRLEAKTRLSFMAFCRFLEIGILKLDRENFQKKSQISNEENDEKLEERKAYADFGER